MPEWVYWFFLVFTFLGVGGLAWGWIEGRLSADAKRAIFVLGSMTVGTFVFAMIAGSQSRFGVQQRWLVPGHPAAMAILALGLVLHGEALAPAATVDGLVRDASGPVAGARVRVRFRRTERGRGPPARSRRRSRHRAAVR